MARRPRRKAQNNAVRRRSFRRAYSNRSKRLNYNSALQNLRPAFMKILHFGRTLLTGFGINGASVNILYNIFLSTIDLLTTQSTKVGSICVFKITPGSLLKQSPLLAKISSEKYSFPAFPVKIKHMTIRLTNTTQMSNKVGKWAAVYIPFREEHDTNKYDNTLKTMIYPELCAMPNARSGNCNQDLVISYRARNQSDYCNRARELHEPVGILTFIWENYDRDDYSKDFQNSDFSCEFEISGEVAPMITLGSNHRRDVSSTELEPLSITKSSNSLFVLKAFGDERFYGTQEECNAHLLGLMAVE